LAGFLLFYIWSLPGIIVVQREQFEKYEKQYSDLVADIDDLQDFAVDLFFHSSGYHFNIIPNDPGAAASQNDNEIGIELFLGFFCSFV
jgi:hypothetical protein